MKTQKGRRLLRRVEGVDEEIAKNKRNKSFTLLHRSSASLLKSMRELSTDNKLNNNRIICSSSTACFHCSTSGDGGAGQGEGYEEGSRKFGASSTFTLISSKIQSHHYSYTRRLGIRQLLILSLLTLIGLLNTNHLCSAQKLIFGNSHNPLQTQNVVIPHIKYGQGLNRWSFLSVDRDNHGLHSDLLCPNPMMTKGTYLGYKRPGTGTAGGVTTRVNPGRGKQQQQQQPPYYQPPQPPQYPTSRFPGGAIGSSASNQQHQPLPNEIWAMKTDEQLSLLPCSLRQFAVPPPFSSGGGGGGANDNAGMVMMNKGIGGAATRHNNGHFIENRILFINVSLIPFNFHGAIPCSKYIKFMYDEQEGTNLRCGHIPFDPRHENKYHINWPAMHNKRKDFFSLLDNLERFLLNEQTLHRQFYFQIYFTSFNGRTKRCSVQQYELDLSYPAGNSRFCNLSHITGQEELCGEFHCDDLIFPLYTDPQPQHHDGKGGGGGAHGKHRGENSVEDYGDDEDYDDDEEDDDGSHEHHEQDKSNKGGDQTGSNSLGQTHRGHQQPQEDRGYFTWSWARMIRTDMRLVIFAVIVPLVLFGVLVFGMELIVYFMCCRKRRGEGDEGGGSGNRSQQLLENSLNVWENVPSRMDAQRTVSFSPMTTSIYGERKNMMMDAASLDSHGPETPKILKSALKNKPGGIGEHSPPSGHHYFDYQDHDMPPSYIETTAR